MLGYEVSVDDAVTQSLNNEEASQVTVYVVRVSREARGLCVMLRFVETLLLLLLLLLLVFFFLIYFPPPLQIFTIEKHSQSTVRKTQRRAPSSSADRGVRVPLATPLLDERLLRPPGAGAQGPGPKVPLQPL